MAWGNKEMLSDLASLGRRVGSPALDAYGEPVYRVCMLGFAVCVERWVEVGDKAAKTIVDAFCEGS
eukprot:930592-Amphidinium_carterae.1